MVYFLSYGDINFPRFFYTNAAKAQQHKVYYEQQGYDVALRETNKPDRIRSVANRWVAMWAKNSLPDIREQREAQAAELRSLAENVSLAVSCPLAARYATSPTHAEYSAVHMFG